MKLQVSPAHFHQLTPVIKLWHCRLDESRGGPERRERLGGQLGRRQRRGRLLGAAQVGAGESGRRHGAVLVS